MTIGTTIGHNSLVKVVVKARKALDRVKYGEGVTEEGWLEYGAALNEGRAVFTSNEEFGQWKHSEGLCDDRCTLCDPLDQVDPNENRPYHMDVQAAMWAAENVDRYKSFRSGFPRVRTIRGVHTKWKEMIEASKVDVKEPELRKPTPEEAERIVKLRDKAESTQSENEREAIQRKLDKIRSEGVDTDAVVDQKAKDEFNRGRDEARRMSEEFADMLLRHQARDIISAIIEGCYGREMEHFYKLFRNELEGIEYNA